MSSLNKLFVVTFELDKNAEIISYEEYYPFGSTSYRTGRNETEVSQKRYKYVMKELDNESGLYYYGMRYYASWLARFISVDPLQHEYPYYTPFQYAGNKPITFIDLDGAEPLTPEAAQSTKKPETTNSGSMIEFSISGYPKLSALLRQMPSIYENSSNEFKTKFKSYSELTNDEILFLLNPNNLGVVEFANNKFVVTPKATVSNKTPNTNVKLYGLTVDNYLAYEWETTSPPNLDDIPTNVTKKYVMNIRTHLEEETYKEMFKRQLFAAYIAYGDALREIIDTNEGVNNIDLTLGQGEFDNVIVGVTFNKAFYEEQNYSSIFRFVKDIYGYSRWDANSSGMYIYMISKDLSQNQDIRNQDIELRDKLLQNAKNQNAINWINFKFDYLNY